MCKPDNLLHDPFLIVFSGGNCSYVHFECYSCWSIQEIHTGFTHSPSPGVCLSCLWVWTPNRCIFVSWYLEHELYFGSSISILSWNNMLFVLCKSWESILIFESELLSLHLNWIAIKSYCYCLHDSCLQVCNIPEV